MEPKPPEPQADSHPLTILKPNPRNPRTIEPERLAALQKSLTKFGDLGGIVRNITTDRLVGGHQRLTVFSASKDTAKVVIQSRQPKDQQGTVALGYVEVPGVGRFAYREVEWTEEDEMVANLAANKHGGEFDFEEVHKILDELPATLDFELTGFLDSDLETLREEFGENGTKKAADGAILARLSVTLGEPKTQVQKGDVWRAGHHTLTCNDVFDGWSRWVGMLQPGMLLLPYAGPLVLATTRGKETPYLVVNPDPYLCGHILDKYREVTGMEPVKA